MSLHCSSLHDCDSVGGRLQRANQTAAADLPGSCQWGCKGTEGAVGLTVWLQSDFSVLLTVLLPSFSYAPLQNIHVCLGSLFVPEAYITATRQYVAQANSWSLEELCLEVNVTTAQGATLDACSFGIKGQTNSASSAINSIFLKMLHSGNRLLGKGPSTGLKVECCFKCKSRGDPMICVMNRMSFVNPLFVSGLKLQGATCANNKLSLSTSISTELPLTQLRWIKQSTAEKRHMVRVW